jgi:ankyrin repeat protein
VLYKNEVLILIYIYMNTPLAYAVQNDHVDAVRLLIEHGADLTVENEYGWSLYKKLVGCKAGSMIKWGDGHHIFHIMTDSKSIAYLLTLINPATEEPYHVALISDDGYDRMLIV